MKFLADENIEQPLIEALRAAGYDVAALTEEQVRLRPLQLPGKEPDE